MKKIQFCFIVLLSFSSSLLARELRIEHVTVVSPERSKPLQDATVSIRDDRIVSVTNHAPEKRASEAAVEVIDGRGLFLTPGLIDSHVHTGYVNGMLPQHEAAHPDIARAAHEQIPRAYLYFGFTTLVDLDSTPEAMAKWSALPAHPDAYFCGAAPIVDGYPTVWQPKPERYRRRYLIVEQGEETAAPEVIDPAAHTPAAVVSRMKADGAHCVKTFFERGEEGKWPVPRLDTIRALVEAAHAARMPVFIHATSTEAQEFALAAGVDIIAHGLWRWGSDAAAVERSPSVKKVLDAVLKEKLPWQPTMQVGYGFRDLFDPGYLSDPRVARVLPGALIEWYRTPEGRWFRDSFAASLLPKKILETRDAEEQWEWVRNFYAGSLAPLTNAVNYLAQKDARLIFGTDTPAAPLYSNPPGLNGWMEMHRLIEAGVTPAQIFRAATLANAEALGLDEIIGTVQPGKRANLLLMRADPTQSIQAYDEIVKVVLNGKVLDRFALAAN